MHFFVCSHVHGCVRGCVQVFRHMCWPLCGGLIWGQPLERRAIPPVLSALIFLRQSFLFTVNMLIRLDGLQGAPGIHLPLLSQHWNYRWAPSPLASMWAPGRLGLHAYMTRDLLPCFSCLSSPTPHFKGDKVVLQVDEGEVSCWMKE